MNYYYLSGDGNVLGPASRETLLELITIGEVSAQTQVCEEGTETWQEAGSVFEGSFATAQVTEPAGRETPPHRQSAEPYSSGVRARVFRDSG